MRPIRAAAIALLALATAATFVTATTAFQAKIVNGTEAMAGEFPFVISLRRASSGRHACGASLLNRAWVLTAAHCVRGYRAEQVNVQYGSVRLNANSSDVVNVTKIFVHERYAPADQYANDIALLKLAKPLQFDAQLSAVRLPQAQQATAGNATVTLIGWGLNATGGSVQQHLQKVQLQTFTDDECSERHQVPMHASNICAGVPAGGKGQCSGDSGGPLLLPDHTQIGIVSWSRKPCTIPPYPGVYTEVSAYVDWMLQTIGDEWEQQHEPIGTAAGGESAAHNDNDDDDDESLEELMSGNLIIVRKRQPLHNNTRKHTEFGQQVMISIRRRATNGHFCAGTALSALWILTAAHCFTYVRHAHEVLLQPMNASVQRIVIHEGYNPTVAIHDIALMQLAQPLSSSLTQSVMLPPMDWTLNEERREGKALLVGWGLNASDGSLQSALHKVNLRLMPLRECAKTLHAPLHATNLCAHAYMAGQCSGDSGGPLLVEHEQRFRLQIGIVSWSRKPCATSAGVFTRVASYTSWIREQISSNDSTLHQL